MWLDRPATWDNGEDIHFCAACQIHGGIKSYVPKMLNGDRYEWGDVKPDYGWDEHASWRKNNHSLIRKKVIDYWHQKGWKPLCVKD